MQPGYYGMSTLFLNEAILKLQGEPNKVQALSALLLVPAKLKYGTFKCSLTADEMEAESTGLHLLNEIGAIELVQNGESKEVWMNPRYAYSGPLEAHHEVIQKFDTALAEAKKGSC